MHCARGGIVGHRARDTAARGLVHRRVEPVETFIDSTHVDGLASIGFDFLHEITIAIIDEGCGLPADGHRNQAVFCVESLGVGAALTGEAVSKGQAAFHARRHIAVGVV